MRKILFFLLSTFVCTSLYAVSIDNSSDIIYAEDGLSAELEIGSKYFDGDEHFFTFVLPSNATIKVTQINSTYIRDINDEQVHIYADRYGDLVNEDEARHIGVFVDTIVNVSTFTVVIDNFLSNNLQLNSQ